MGGGLMQLVAYGAQDIYLTGNPQITFWKVVYRRCTNFAIESVEQTFMGNATPGSRATATISRNGDLVSNCVLEVSITARSGRNAAGDADINTKLQAGGMYNLVESVEVEIGGQKIDKHYGAWMDIWSELACGACAPNGSDTNTKRSGKCKVVGHSETALTDPYAANVNADVEAVVSGSHTFYVPLCFWFNRNPGLALPLIALQYHEVKFNFQFSSVSNIFSHNEKVHATNANAVTADAGTAVDSATVNSIKMFVDYIYLDTEERRRFAQQSHEYLIDQVQYTGAVSRSSGAGASQSLRLDFNHPCKELVWVERNQTANAGLCNFEADMGKQGGSALLQLNGHDRFAKRPMNYFTRVQPLQHHTNVPYGDRIGVYSFGLRPEDHQPSGTCNFSRIDNATLQLTLADAAHADGSEFQVYATNYNVLRIMSGMGGLAYSN